MRISKDSRGFVKIHKDFGEFLRNWKGSTLNFKLVWRITLSPKQRVAVAPKSNKIKKKAFCFT